MAKLNLKKSKNAPKQSHKLVWITLIILAVPCVIVLFVIQSSVISQGKPVTGRRFKGDDLVNEITDEHITSVQTSMSGIDGVEEATVDLKSATLRVHLNMRDDISQEDLENALDSAYDRINEILPVATYFTNTDSGKMYDLELDAYNYIVDETHSQDGQIYVKIVKTGAGKKSKDVLTSPKDEELVNQIKR